MSQLHKSPFKQPINKDCFQAFTYNLRSVKNLNHRNIRDFDRFTFFSTRLCLCGGSGSAKDLASVLLCSASETGLLILKGIFGIPKNHIIIGNPIELMLEQFINNACLKYSLVTFFLHTSYDIYFRKRRHRKQT